MDIQETNREHVKGYSQTCIMLTHTLDCFQIHPCKDVTSRLWSHKENLPKYINFFLIMEPMHVHWKLLKSKREEVQVIPNVNT